MMFKKILFVTLLSYFSFASYADKCWNAFDDKTLTGVLNPKIFKANDIRGVVSKDFNSNFPKSLGRAIATLSNNEFSVPISQQKFLIGYDARDSSPGLAETLSDTLVQQGSTVSNVGLVPTPLIYFLVHHYNYTAGVIITASHNPIGYNGFKIMFNDKYKNYNVISQIKETIDQKNFLNEEKSSGKRVDLDPFTPYIESLKKEFPNLKPLSFVVDTGNGAVGPLAKKVFSALGLKPIYLYTEPDGTFPNHHPNPVEKENLIDLENSIKENKSLFGVGFDGDGDRIGIVIPKNNKLIQSDEFAFMFLPTLSNDSNISKTLIADVKVSNWYYKKAEEMGFEVIMSESGYSFLRNRMKNKKASLAMELSGHIMFNDRKGRGFDDALYNSIRFIELIGNNNNNIEKLLPKVNTFKTPEIRLKLDVETMNQAVNNLSIYLKEKKEDYVDIDGVRITRDNSWILVRRSKTEPVLSLRFEGKSKKEVLDFIKEFSEVMKIKIPEEEILIDS